MNKTSKNKRLFLKIFYRFFGRIDENIILFTSFGGDYSDNPKYISQELHKKTTKQIYWILSDINNIEVPNYVKRVKKDSTNAEKIYGKAKIIIDNNYGNKAIELHSNSFIKKLIFSFKIFLHNKPNQHVYTTWHGTPLKKMGVDALNANIVDFACPNTTMILGDEYTANIMRHLTFEKIPIKIFGSPRNDILFSVNNKDAVFRKLKLDGKRKYVVYAPSFRETSGAGNADADRSGLGLLTSIDFRGLSQALEKKFGGKWSIICRFHYHVADQIDWKKIKKEFGDLIINGNEFQDMAEYLSVADALVTDVSSSMFDYMLTYKPVFLFFPDYEQYNTVERGLYIDPTSLPFSISKDYDTLIRNINGFDKEKYRNNVDKLKKEFNYFENNNSAYTIAEYILRDTRDCAFKKRRGNK